MTSIHTQRGVALAFSLTLLAAPTAHAYYNPSTGRWLTRDPLAESGGANLQVTGANNLINNVDFVGLLELRFRKNAIRWFGGDTSGPWSQPDGFGDGVYTTGYSYFSSWIRLWSGPVKGGICNSIDGNLRLPDVEGHKDDNPQSSHHAGAFIVDAKHDCGGRFRLYFSTDRTVKARGPNGNAMASLWLYGRGEKALSALGNETKQVSIGTTIDVSLNNKWKPIIFYYPTISFVTTWGTPWYESGGEAFGSVDFLGYDQL